MNGTGTPPPPPPAKLRRRDGPSGSRGDATRAAGARGEGGGARSGGGGLETALGTCWEQGEGGLETALGRGGGLETTTGLKGGLETTTGFKGGLETTTGFKGGLETASGCKGGLETIVGHCLEQGEGSLETTLVSKGGVDTTSVAIGSLETTSKVRGSRKTTSRRKGSLETTIIRCLEQGGEGKEVLEPPKEDLEPTSTTSSEQVPGGKILPEPREGFTPVVRPKSHIPEDCAVISLGEEEEEEDEEEDEGPERFVAALVAAQVELEALEEEAARAFSLLQAQFQLRRSPHLRRRNRLIRHIPGFWVTAFLNHPQLSAVISDRDEDALSYMTSLQVEEFGPTHPGCRIRFLFGVNPYFQNHVLAKEFTRGPAGHLVSHSTPIRWWQGQDPRTRPPHKGPPTPRSFFAWFGDHSFPAGDRIAEIIKEELWPNPLRFYLLGQGTPDSESGEDCVVIVDDDEDVQEIPDEGEGSSVEEVLEESPQMDPKGTETN